ncbi:methyltransferase domain-containing protein [Sphingomonas sp. NSE70-1]|uniref:Methyltransferase domain-containing protein n=1 Tax=Sphingomonas caseinilyticus TaxID=2908205 RepID=A0ABT0RRP7_9SPHN|nr:class I SAM-dependent methyltransferase [Sphingomonas caseinilyticus]MCL6697675.1 methyltransferase domain-containing protein [Sphingomonas caseinilyticus]
MLIDSIKQFISSINVFSRLKKIETKYSDIQIELSQFISLLNLKDKSISVPPKHLQIRVAGTYNDKFFISGQRMLDDIERILQSNGQSLFKFDNILDFGCGCGRLMIPLGFMVPPGRISGTDIDIKPIRWLNAHYPSFQDVDVNRVKVPTKYPDGKFDFIFSISVFTHLPEKMQNAWLAELSRILKPGGIGLFTTHGENHYSKLPKAGLSEINSRGFYYSTGSGTDGLPDFYQTSYHTHAYIRRRWSKYFDVLSISAEGIGRNQDAVLVRKRH